MYNISSNLRFLIWIAVGIAGVLAVILGAYLESNFSYIVRKFLSPSAIGRPPKKTHPFAWLVFIFCVLISVLGTAIASTTPDNLPTPKATPTEKQNLSPITVSATPFKGKIGVVVGHWGNDAGTVCTDENGQITLVEADVNFGIATKVQQNLSALGFQSELLKEFDSRLSNYDGDIVISIHADSCQYINDGATGFKVSPATSHSVNNGMQKLVECLIDNYQKTTGLAYHKFVTTDMSEYHSFSEINSSIPVGVIEIGYLNMDRILLVERPDSVAAGITNGLMCYFSNNQVMDNFVFDLLGFGSLNNQRIFIMNVSGQTISLEGWRVEDDFGNVFEFPGSEVLQSDNKLYVYNYQPPTQYDLYWQLPSFTAWKSSTIRLRDKTNNIRAIEVIP
jgi:N-acetylmuramoyl-L-alanine amidase